MRGVMVPIRSLIVYGACGTAADVPAQSVAQASATDGGLLAAGATTESIAVVSAAYSADPALANKALPEGLFGDREDFRRVRIRVAVYANKHATASAWLSHAVQTQAEGRHDRAMEILQRARRVGGDKSMADALDSALRTAMTPPPSSPPQAGR